MNNRKYNIRGILKEVKEKERSAKRELELINKLCIAELKSCNIYTIAKRKFISGICKDEDCTLKKKEDL